MTRRVKQGERAGRPYIRGKANRRQHQNSGRPIASPAPYRPQYCDAKKDNGEKCKARPVKDEIYCIGHKRSLNAEGRN